jgi:hypothetical protein
VVERSAEVKERDPTELAELDAAQASPTEVGEDRLQPFLKPPPMRSPVSLALVPNCVIDSPSRDALVDVESIALEVNPKRGCVEFH